jgi:type I restriction enzyme S subunit
VQLTVASTLSAYDDLIETNTRRIQVLERMARAIYREWFVNFRFPGHGKVKLVASPLGPIPQGWIVENLFDAAEVTYGFPFKSKEFTTAPKGRPVIRIRDILPNRSETYTDEAAEAKHLVTNGDVLVGMDGDFHMGKWAGGEAWLNQRVVRFRPKTQLGRYHLFLALEKPIHHFDSTIVGTTVAHLSDKDLRATFLPIPPSALFKHVAGHLEPLFDLELNLRIKNANLRRTRDLLLPRLLSGSVFPRE